MTLGPVGATRLKFASVLSSFIVATSAWSESPPLSIQVSSEQAIVANGSRLTLATRIRNDGATAFILHLSQCAYSSIQWEADTPFIQVQTLACKKNRVIDIPLEPGETHEQALPVRVEIPLSEVPRALRFRLGFKPGNRAAESAAAKSSEATAAPPIWSNLLELKIDRTGGAAEQPASRTRPPPIPGQGDADQGLDSSRAAAGSPRGQARPSVAAAR